ncbi:exodeoxyribonuclease VII large subunit [Nanchangia anserum]|uniref:Exodeoxyribonuclease 7 large subunit n=1 Tax=Nanchangia anserum TaxID=2692125 RepID=A0A8I0GD54_9ACTO|nr:exodeoxyribonuclease VII large subunit [Nanchangia anserum]MBD3689965.1 exodeoxyribonuclease VII large subunit [Nanchangia anserum]QOX82229.1 exodeoxyribonuclease VII large subunit [Nanchangia anserum]
MGRVPSQSVAPTAAATTRDNPWPLSLLTTNIERVVHRMSEMWVSGQVVEYQRRPATRLAFFVLRDLHADTSMSVSCFPGIIDSLGPAFCEGASVVIKCRPNFWKGKGTLSLRASDIHIAGIGSLLADIEKLRARLREEGLFAAERKRPLPFLPRRVGLICGSNAKARHDVEVNASARWPGLAFCVREVAIQGPRCVAEVSAALRELDGLDDVDVIVIARGGGAVEDLLPFSDEHLVRAVAAARTPVVSAIGHESDAPLLDYVADYRASTPTDAARRIVPDLAEETAVLREARQRCLAVVRTTLERERTGLSDMRSRRVMSSPAALLNPHRERLDVSRHHLRQAQVGRLEGESARLRGARETLRALSPRAVMERGYAIVRAPNRQIVHSVADVSKGDLIELLFADGSGVAQVAGTRATTIQKEES